jgi:hypothetical protein
VPVLVFVNIINIKHIAKTAEVVLTVNTAKKNADA